MMGLKSIFREGMKERQRKKSLRSEKNEFKSKEKSYAGQLTAIGKKAWEAKTDISAFGDLRSALSETQKALDDLQLQVKDLQEQKKAAAELDQKIASLNKALTANVSKRTEAEKALNQNFFHLGEKLSAASPP